MQCVQDRGAILGDMARPKSPRKAENAGSVFIRWSAEEYAVIRRCMDAQAAGVVGADTITVAAFCRGIVMAECKKRLGLK